MGRRVVGMEGGSEGMGRREVRVIVEGWRGGRDGVGVVGGW